MKTAVKDANGRTLGYQVTRGSQVIAEDASGAVVGRYDGNTKKTFDSKGKAVYRGNQTATLISDGTKNS